MSLKSWTLRNVVLPAALLPTRSRYLTLARQIEGRQRWPIDRIQELQLAALQAQAKRALEVSEFYRERWSSLGLRADSLKTLADVERFPVTAKEDIEQNFPDRMTASANRTEDWQYIGTRGTTRRVIVIKDFARRDADRANELVVLTSDSPFGLGECQMAIPPDACSTHCGLENFRPPRTRDILLELALRKKRLTKENVSDLRGLVMDRWVRNYHSVPPLRLDGKDDSLEECLDTIQRLRPKQLIALPEYLRALADYVVSQGESVSGIQVIRPMGANMPASWRPSIEEALGGVLREHYGSREMGPMAFDCQQRCGLHTLMDQHLIEIVDPQGHQVPDGELGQVLVTDLQNHVMPIFRYRIGDLARIFREPCRCGRTTARLQLEGRLDDALVTPGSNFVTAEQVANFLWNHYQISQFELVEQSGRPLKLRYVPPPTKVVDDATLTSHLANQFELSTSIRATKTQLIRPEASGKYRHCRSASFADLAVS